MSSSIKKEAAVISRQSSNCSAGVPIKKRKFPFVQPPSPPQQECLSLTLAENTSSSPSQESSLSNAVDGTSSLGKANASVNSVIKIEKEITADSNDNLVGSRVDLSHGKHQGPILSQTVETLDTVDVKEKLFIAAPLNLTGITKPDLAPNEASNTGVEASSLRKSDTSKFLESGKEIPAATNANLVGFSVNLSSSKAQSPMLPILSEAFDTVGIKEKPFVALHQNMTEISNLDLAPTEACAGQVTEKVPSKLQVGRDCTPELFGMSIELSLGPREPHIPVMSPGQSSDISGQIPNSFDKSSLSLSFSQDNSEGRGCEGADIKVDRASTHVHLNRSNWDLNTSMEAWEQTANGGDDPHGLRELKVSCFTRGNIVEPIISSTVLPGVDGDAGEQLQESDRIASFPGSSLHPCGRCGSEDSLHLSLCSSRLNFTVEHSTSSVKLDIGKALPNAKIVEEFVSTGSTTAVGCDAVKSEPFVENVKRDCPRSNSVGILDFVNRKLVDSCTTKAVSSSNVSSEKGVESRSIKSEPLQEDNEDKRVMISHTSVDNVAFFQDYVSSSLVMALEPKMSCPSDFRVCSELSTSEDASNQLNYSTFGDIDNDKTHGSCKMVDMAAGGMDSVSLDREFKELNACEDMVYSDGPDDANADDPEKRLEALNYGTSNSYRSSGSSGSHEENVNIIADILEEDSDGFDYVSDANHDVVAHKESEGRHGCIRNEYEDVEVQGAPLHLGGVVSMDDRGEEKIIRDDSVDKRLEAANILGDGFTAGASNCDDFKVDMGESNDDHTEESADDARMEAYQVTDRDCSMQESSTVEEAAPSADEKRSIETALRGQADLSGRNDIQKDLDKEEFSDLSTNSGQNTEVIVNHITNVNTEGTNTTEKVDPTLPKTDQFVNDKDAAKDANSGANRSRIINLSRSSNLTSPRRFISDRPLLSTTGRERFSDIEGEGVHVRRNRDEFYADGPRKYDRDRFQDQPFRNSRNFSRNFARGIGRGFRQRREWDSDRYFDEQIYNGRNEYRFPKHKHGSAGIDADFEGDGYDIAPPRDLGISRGERKSNSDELRPYRHPSSRKLSPGDNRDGTGTRGNHLMRRFPGNGNPSRCSGEHDSDLVAIGHGEQFMRVFPEDNKGMLIRSRATNEGLNFSVQRRGILQMRSKSPERSRTRSPVPWSSPHKRSPDGFSGHPSLSHHRSQTIYRMERIKSHNRPCYTEEIVSSRRCGSPPYGARSSNDLTYTDSEKVGQPRSSTPNRKRPFDRVLPRSTRRFDMIDPRESTENDEYVRVPNRSGRFNEAGGDGRVDERRKCGDRRGLVRSFRSSFNGADGENLHFHPDNGPETSRVCQEADSDFIERHNMRERDFDRRIRNKPGIAPTRARNMDDDEGNYRHGGQHWQNNEFDDVSQMKRRRF